MAVRKKSLQKFLDKISKKTFGRTHSEALGKNICVFCGEGANHFKDDLSKKEYLISGICQECQDGIFEPKEKSNASKRKTKD